MHLSWLDPHKMRKMTVVGTEKMAVFDDMELDRKVTVYEKSPWRPVDTYGEWQTRTGDIHIPKIATDEPAARCSTSCGSCGGAGAVDAHVGSLGRPGWPADRGSRNDEMHPTRRPSARSGEG
jgi:hypothetical protein